ncbi:Peroxidase 64 [Hibiscus syriacus]|uniref:peroxidase n=1 Tax=Hibiscus syriacus TaxID=106335 RepID=A0A6A3AUQ9_HIBSY|nr:Peroxidase 64 [Hibiscus syriacus]
MKDKTVPAALLRMHFHDCFIRGCDASVLLYSKGNNKAEKDGPANLSLHGFYVIENAKKEVEAVSCPEVLWDVPKGRKDGECRRLAKPYNCQLQPSTFSTAAKLLSERPIHG